MRFATVVMLATLASLGTRLWHLHLLTRARMAAEPPASPFEGFDFPLLFSGKAEVAWC